MNEGLMTTREALTELRDALVGCAVGLGAANFLQWLF